MPVAAILLFAGLSKLILVLSGGPEQGFILKSFWLTLCVATLEIILAFCLALHFTKTIAREIAIVFL